LYNQDQRPAVIERRLSWDSGHLEIDDRGCSMPLTPLRALGNSSWDSLIGYQVFSADNHLLGTIDGVRQDIGLGKTCLDVRSQATTEHVRVPISAVGVITESRIMLDLNADRFPGILGIAGTSQHY
jgi:hypothetical protein